MDTANKAMTAQKAMIVRPNQIIPLSGFASTNILPKGDPHYRKHCYPMEYNKPITF